MKKNVRHSMGAEVKRLRKEAKLNQQGLADLVGVHQTTISSIESDDHPIQVPQLVRVEQALGVPPGHLYSICYNEELGTRTTRNRCRAVDWVGEMDTIMDRWARFRRSTLG